MHVFITSGANLQPYPHLLFLLLLLLSDLNNILLGKRFFYP